MPYFEPGQTVKTDFGAPIKIIKFLAAGGQGEVYVVEYAGKKKALKWYTDAGRTPKAFYKNLKNNVNHGSPDKAFLWPEAITAEPVNFDEESFGYIMDLRPDGYYEMSQIFLGKHKMSFISRVDASLNIINAFRILHNQGYSYQDMNDGNFFINPDNGDVMVCDNDNVAPNKYNTGILGKPRYMAPELAREERGSDGKFLLPDTQTDRYSLSCILFMLLCGNHPLEGSKWCVPCLNDANARELYGTNPIFIFDPKDKSNGPKKGVHDKCVEYWKCLPDYMQDAFIEAFSKDSLFEPNKRKFEKDWMKLYVRFRSEIAKCSCGNEVFIKNANSTPCDRCGRMMNVEHSFEFAKTKYLMAARHGARIYKCQIATCNADEALDKVAVVVVNRSTGELGVMNKTNLTLEAVTTTGNTRQVPSGTVIPFKSGIVLKAFDGQVKFN